MNIKDLKNKSVILFLNGGFNLSGTITALDKKTLVIKTQDGDDFLVFKNKILSINFSSPKSIKEKPNIVSLPSDEAEEKGSGSYLNDNVFVVRSKNKPAPGPVEVQSQDEDDRCIPIDLTNMKKPDKISGNYDEDFSISLASLQHVSSQPRPENKK